MSDKFSCDECGDEFDSERGLHIHQSQVHSEEDKEKTEAGDEKEVVLNISTGRAVMASFVIGLILGGFLMGSAGVANLSLNSIISSSDSDRIEFSASDFSEDPTVGSADAPVRIVQVTDYGCPWCAEWNGVNTIPSRDIDQTQTYQKIESNYIETGEVKMTVLDYPAHPNALQVHKAATCAYETNESSYPDFSSKLYENREEWLGSQSGDDRPRETIKSVANSTGLNKTEILSCVDSKDNSEIQKDVRLASSKVGQVGTPLFFIGNEESGYVKMSGAQTYSSISKVLDQELQKTE